LWKQSGLILAPILGSRLYFIVGEVGEADLAYAGLSDRNGGQFITVHCAARINTLNIATGSYGGRPPFAPSEYANAASNTGRKASK
jgi:hypothetical protein